MAVIRPFVVGFATTLKYLFRKPITINYPEEKMPMFPKWRGKQVLMRDENGLEKCVACGLCSVACPADAIYLVTEIYPSHVVLDGNHPLAGMALRIRIKVVSVREASDEEAEARSLGGSPLSVMAGQQRPPPGPLH